MRAGTGVLYTWQQTWRAVCQDSSMLARTRCVDLRGSMVSTHHEHLSLVLPADRLQRESGLCCDLLGRSHEGGIRGQVSSRLMCFGCVFIKADRCRGRRLAHTVNQGHAALSVFNVLLASGVLQSKTAAAARGRLRGSTGRRHRHLVLARGLHHLLHSHLRGLLDGAVVSLCVLARRSCAWTGLFDAWENGMVRPHWSRLAIHVAPTTNDSVRICRPSLPSFRNSARSLVRAFCASLCFAHAASRSLPRSTTVPRGATDVFRLAFTGGVDASLPERPADEPSPPRGILRRGGRADKQTFWRVMCAAT